MTGLLVSVCIRAYGPPEFLTNAIASVLAQTYDSFEIVVSDDSGRLGAVAERFADPRVRYSANPRPAGPAANLRRAIGLAKGAAIAILNEDDAWLPDFLATTVARLEADPDVGVVLTNTLWDLGGRRVPSATSITPDHHDDYLGHVLEHGVICSAALLRREVWDQGERELPLTAAMVGDAVTWLRAAQAGWPFEFVDEPLAVLRVHRGQISWSDGYWPRQIATLEAFRFADARCERLRLARLAEAHMACARAHLKHGRVALARREIGRARHTHPTHVGIRGLLALTGVREFAIRRVSRQPWLLARVVPLWGRVRPPVLS